MNWQDIAVRFAANAVAEHFHRHKIPHIIAFYEIYPHKRALRTRISAEVQIQPGQVMAPGMVRQLLYKDRRRLNALILERLIELDGQAESKDGTI